MRMKWELPTITIPPRKKRVNHPVRQAEPLTNWLKNTQIMLSILVLLIAFAAGAVLRLHERSQTSIVSRYSQNNAARVADLRYQNTIAQNRISQLESSRALQVRVDEQGISDRYALPEDPSKIEFITVVIPQFVVEDVEDIFIAPAPIPRTVERAVFLWAKDAFIGFSEGGDQNE